ncbi:MAG TPA: hypothetical protein VNT75_09740 [Symbiobacteriaceae bacterium]|nr:hypothetical protein [Symbiobacteriaceae bacterium]
MDYDAVAARRGLSVDEVRRQYRHIELTDEETGAQFTINDWGVSITLPYWHKTGKADSVFAELWACLSVIEATTGYVTYDPQLERVLSLRRDQAEVIRRYVGVSDHLEELVSGQTVAEVPNRLPEAKKRPWWKFW